MKTRKKKQEKMRKQAIEVSRSQRGAERKTQHNEKK